MQQLLLSFYSDGNLGAVLAVMSAKNKICEKCKLRNRCGDLPGFCALIYFIPVVLLVVMLVYFFVTMKL